ncbi:type IV pilus modification protein PilV [Variovorax sp. YR752]|uniref:type IV pilus modification protein PilV n=1 Tax=unclassified Variovorax TaxID=663243 RepID=UPI000BE432B0|nr:type IV pilus modification protein PilV [Variovorax sp. YR752]
MPHRQTPSSAMGGFTLIEVMAALLIFAIGLLGITGLYASAARTATGAEFRTTAAMLASDLISRMWMSDRTAATLQANYGSTAAGTGYTSWKATVDKSNLPGIGSLPPTVTFSTVAGGGSSAVSSSLATITIYWKGPGDSSAHQYVAMAQMKP